MSSAVHLLNPYLDQTKETTAKTLPKVMANDTSHHARPVAGPGESASKTNASCAQHSSVSFAPMRVPRAANWKMPSQPRILDCNRCSHGMILFRSTYNELVRKSYGPSHPETWCLGPSIAYRCGIGNFNAAGSTLLCLYIGSRYKLLPCSHWSHSIENSYTQARLDLNYVLLP